MISQEKTREMEQVIQKWRATGLWEFHQKTAGYLPIYTYLKHSKIQNWFRINLAASFLSSHV